jgi:GNAT superfamily N-acetyltransferase
MLYPVVPATVRPADRTDALRLATMLSELSGQSFYQRFLTGPGLLSPRLCRLLVASTPGSGAVVATSGARLVAHACWAFEPQTEASGPVAEVAVVTADAWQGRGLGTRLLTAVARDAVDAGARTATMYVLADNRRVRARLARRWPDVAPAHDGVLVVYRVPAESVAGRPAVSVA